ncbi:molybdate transport system substrate-binding protein [Mycolicibacterium iranicum]|uniref:Molybdate transport system substrate-binding protein n=1 Tax=Mycolicibacterium iranicum TaxID=912594 RepID=A0A839QCT8_MYCIR|nr:molybdate ABC transporter substrate-binding protein [Mycolicibacterium iranicum]MBB2990321.1 molybdate transport system substrate-binding protein [Mycolicibacterium iranicum]
MRTAAVLGIAALLAGCSAWQDDSGSAAEATILVFAAASLKSVFADIGTRFEQDNPGTTVIFNFAGSSDLVTQLEQGAPADVFASADTTNMTKAVDAGVIAGEPVNFAANTLTIVTPPGNPAGITSFADLAEPGTQVVICAPQVPCGSATEKIEKATGVTLAPVSEESAVTDVLGKVTSGQADAGLVYVTDASGAGDKAAAIPFPESAAAVNVYPIATVAGTAGRAAADRFVSLVTGPYGREALASAGFAAP